MNTNQAKQINLAKFLARLGYQPTKEQNHNLWYKSPLRNETEASFKVDTNRNYWYDFGLGKGGTIIDFVAELKNTANISEVLTFIEKHTGMLEQFYVSNVNESVKNLFSFHKQKEASKREVYISDLKENILFTYLKQRGISEQYTPSLRQGVIFQNDKHYHVLAFRNDKDGYELNNRYHKSCTSKAITSIKENTSKPVFVFERFFDFLSFWELAKKDSKDAVDYLKASNFIVLNSVALTKEAITALKPFADIRLFLDNDDAGASAGQEIMNAYPSAQNFAHLYKGYKDLNDFLTSADRPSFVGFISRCAIVLTETKVLSRNGDLAFTPEGRKRERAILPNFALRNDCTDEEQEERPRIRRGRCR